MPIVSKQLFDLGQQADGKFSVREEHTDTLGIVHPFLYRAPLFEPADPPDGTSAREIFNARDLTPSLRDRDFADIASHVAQGFNNHPGTFEYVSPARDITEIEAEDQIVAAFFGEAIGDDAAPYAWWIQNLNNPQWGTIEARLGYTSDQGDDIRSRATVIIVAAPEYNSTIDDPR